MNVVCLTTADESRKLLATCQNQRVQFCTDSDAVSFPCQRDTVFVVAFRDERTAARLMRFLRQDAATGLQPVYTMHSFGKPLDLLADGILSSLEDIEHEAGDILARLAELPDAVFQPDTSDYLRILALLYSRPDRQLAPHRVWLDEHAYAYALLEALLGSAHLVAARLAALCELGHLQRCGLIDRTSHCPECSSLQLNLVDHCPDCGGTDLEESADLRCLHCGHVAPELAFVSEVDEGLVCCRCKARLLQIKTDYDQMQGSFSCRACGSTFVQPESRAHCLRCGHHAPVNRLLVRRIYSYELTDPGIAALKRGAALEQADRADECNLVSPPFFINMVNWLLDFCGRHSTETFTLIGIRLDIPGRRPEELTQEETELLDTFSYRVSERIRTIDMLSRFRRDMLWLLLPRTGKPHFQVVLDRIIDLQKIHRGQENEALAFRTVIFHAPDEVVPGESSALLLNRLEAGFAGESGEHENTEQTGM